MVGDEGDDDYCADDYSPAPLPVSVQSAPCLTLPRIRTLG